MEHRVVEHADSGRANDDSSSSARRTSGDDGHLLARAPAPELPLSQTFSIELVAPPNTQQSDELAGGDVEMLSQDLDEQLSAHTSDSMGAHIECDPIETNDIHGDNDDGDAEMNENVIQVREILADMLRAESATTSSLSILSSKEREREEREQLQMYQLRCCVLDDASLEELEKLPKRMCAYEFKPGDIAWNCRVCQVQTDGRRGCARERLDRVCD